ncbi:hypothetical protein ACFLWG_04075 [Chloroflexota bacterium]
MITALCQDVSQKSKGMVVGPTTAPAPPVLKHGYRASQAARPVSFITGEEVNRLVNAASATRIGERNHRWC